MGGESLLDHLELARAAVPAERLDGAPAVRHQVHFHLRCEGRAIALVARILGNSAPRLAEQYLGQLQMFYGGMGWYIYQDDKRARKLFRDAGLSYPLTTAATQ